MKPDPVKATRGIRKRGNRLGFWFFETFVHVFGLQGAYGLLYLVCPYYLLFDRSAVAAALAYIDKRFPDHGFVRKRLHVLRLFISQGKQLIDRHYAVFGPGFDVRVRERDRFVDLVRKSANGMILLTSHVGNWQLAMTALGNIQKTVHLLMRPEDNPAVRQSLGVGREQSNIRRISPEDPLGGVVEMMQVLSRGDIVSIMGDRTYGARALEVTFMGRPAWFPYSAFAMAAAARCPLVVLTAAKTTVRRYLVDVSTVIYPQYRGRRNRERQLRPWVQEFVHRLEAFIEAYPYQCFLFHDVWRKEGAGRREGEGSGYGEATE